MCVPRWQNPHCKSKITVQSLRRMLLAPEHLPKAGPLVLLMHPGVWPALTLQTVKLGKGRIGFPLPRIYARIPHAVLLSSKTCRFASFFYC